MGVERCPKEEAMENLSSSAGGGVSPHSRDEVLEWGGRLASELDPRLADVWSCLFSMDAELTLEEIAWFLRMAYLNGYEDGLTEIRRGALLEQLGMEVPKRGSSRR
jgi:hypothetical protein